MDKTTLVEKIKAQLPLSHIIKNAVELKGRGPNFLGLCPFHDEKTPSFHVRDQVGRYKCFGCGASGDVIEFIMRLRGLSFNEAVAELAERLGLDASRTRSIRPDGQDQLLRAQKVAQVFFVEQLLKRAEGKQALLYLKKNRGLSDQMIQQAALGFGGSSTQNFIDHLKKFRVSKDCAIEAGLLKQARFSIEPTFLNRIIFPIRNYDGHIIAFGGRSFLKSDNDEAKYVNTHRYRHYEKRQQLYGLYESKAAILKGMPLTLVEGYLDAMAFWAIGMPAIASCGTAISKEHVAKLSSLSKKMLLCFDADSAGRKALRSCLGFFLAKDITPRGITIDEGDPGSFLSSGKLEQLKNYADHPHDALCSVIDHAAKKALLSVSERIAQLDSLVEILSKISRPLIRRQYVSYLAKRLNEDPALLWSEIQSKCKKKSSPKPNAKKSEAILLNDSDRLLLRIIFADPSLLDQVADLIESWPEQLKDFVNDIVDRDQLVELLKTKHKILWPVLAELVLDPIEFSNEEAATSLSALKRQKERIRTKQALQKKREEMQQFEKNKDFSSVIKSLKERSEILMASKPKKEAKIITKQTSVSEKAEPKKDWPAEVKTREISQLDEEGFFDDEEDWL